MTFEIFISILIVGLSILMPIYYSYKRKKDKYSEAMERMQIREYGRKINEQARHKK